MLPCDLLLGSTSNACTLHTYTHISVQNKKKKSVQNVRKWCIAGKRVLFIQFQHHELYVC